jgi:hypothetical protein
MKNLNTTLAIILTFMLIGCTDITPDLQLLSESSTTVTSINPRYYSEIVQNLQIASNGTVWVSAHDEVGYQCIYSIDEGVIKKYVPNTFAYVDISSPMALLDNKPYYFQKNGGFVFLSYIENDSIYHLYDSEMNDLDLGPNGNYIPLLTSTENGLFTGDYYYNGNTWKPTELGLDLLNAHIISKNNYVLGISNQYNLFSYDCNENISHTYNEYLPFYIKIAINNNGQGFVLDKSWPAREIYEIDLQTGNSTKIVLPESIETIYSIDASPNNELVVLARFRENFITKYVIYNYTTQQTTDISEWPGDATMFIQKNGVIWVHLGNTLRAYKGSMIIEEMTNMNESSWSRMFEDDNGYFWFLSTSGGMDKFFRYKDGVFEDYKKFFNTNQ